MVRTHALVALFTTLSVFALNAAPTYAQSVSARDRQSAAQAYDRGTAAYLAGDYADAARWFETAHRLAPASAALIQAVRAYARAGNALRVATLGLRLQALYPDDATAQQAAQRALRDANRFVRVDVECEERCTVQVDGAVMEHPSFFVQPRAEHRIDVEFQTGTLSDTVRGEAGGQLALRFEAPPPPPEPEIAPGGRTEPSDPTSPARASSGGGVPLWVTLGAGVATAAVGGVLIWSGVDTFDGVPDYEMNPTPEKLADGQAREERTNWLIAGTSALAVTTVLLAIFTDWSGEPEDAGEVQASFGVDADAVMGSLRGRF